MPAGGRSAARRPVVPWPVDTANGFLHLDLLHDLGSSVAISGRRAVNCRTGCAAWFVRHREGRLTINEHGNRRVTRLEKTGALTVLADRYLGKRLNSPNDLVYRSDGALYFTDPPFGLPKSFDDPRKELPSSGVFCLINGELKLVSRDLSGPNGLAFSPGERHLYVGNWDPRKKVVMRYEVQADGTLANGHARS